MLAHAPIRQRIARLLLGLLLLMQINSVLFRHAHRLANGQIVTHAHPYNLFSKSCPLSANPHTTHELLLLDAVSNAAFVPTFALLIAFLLLLVRFIIRSVPAAPTNRIRTVCLARPTLRGPPSPLSFRH
ncbi:hypothetical protein [Spirosoma sp.]|uniref:hypothetical protein n=1 Tax=Spirosoma sp. TaxID=1899569 RepID=UPI00261FE31C|nr:hypothetical protein [Spirosoma sp.]MCX6213599.1 hypothetical protein [Spirosoma sp.]